MDRTRRLREIWNWLPAFRAVAETEHLPSASNALHVSPASLSRTIGLLAANIGSPLFDRVGRGLKLNGLGKRLLDSVRDGMRAIDEGVAAVDGKLWTGSVGLWAERAYASHLLLPLVRRLRVLHPELHVRVCSDRPKQIGSRILRGEIDLAVLERPPVHTHLQVDVVKQLRYELFCGPENALCTRDTMSLAEFAEKHCFAMPSAQDAPGGVTCWPADSRPQHTVAVDDLSMADEACLTLGLLAALPRSIANKNVHALPVHFAPKASLYAVYRKPVGKHPRTESLVEILQELSQGGDA